MEEMYGPETIRVMSSIKKVLDPKGIMNPGKVLRVQYL
jgi:FAD/FMN-containing dehydrogenase